MQQKLISYKASPHQVAIRQLHSFNLHTADRSIKRSAGYRSAKC